MPYSELLVRPMREELTSAGVEELRTPADVDACLAVDTTTIVPVYLPDVDKVVCGPR